MLVNPGTDPNGKCYGCGERHLSGTFCPVIIAQAFAPDWRPALLSRIRDVANK